MCSSFESLLISDTWTLLCFGVCAPLSRGLELVNAAGPEGEQVAFRSLYRSCIKPKCLRMYLTVLFWNQSLHAAEKVIQVCLKSLLMSILGVNTRNLSRD